MSPAHGVACGPNRSLLLTPRSSVLVRGGNAYLPLHFALIIGLNGPPLFLLKQRLMRLVRDDRQPSFPTEPVPPSLDCTRPPTKVAGQLLVAC